MKRRRSTASGLTLVEVVVSLALLGGTLAGLCLAHSRALRQIAESDRSRRAATLAEQLIRHWRIDPQMPWQDAEGTFLDPEGWWWRRHVQPEPVDDLIRLQLSIHGLDERGDAIRILTVQWTERRSEQPVRSVS